MGLNGTPDSRAAGRAVGLAGLSAQMYASACVRFGQGGKGRNTNLPDSRGFLSPKEVSIR